MTNDPKSLVASGYDIIAEAYLERYRHSRIREYWLRELIALLPPRARVLDLGCGAGATIANELSVHGFAVVGVDGSARQIQLARGDVRGAEFLHADMTEVVFSPASFDAVTAFYSITHVPRHEHAALLRRIATWLRPNGLFLASLGSADLPDWRGEWLGTQMFFSHYTAEINKRLVHDAGFAIERAELVDQDDEDARFLWVIARLVGREAAG